MMLGGVIFCCAWLLRLVKSDYADIPGLTVVSFKEIKATSSSPSVCADTDREDDVTSFNDDLTVDRCANR